MAYIPDMQHALCLFRVILAKQITRERMSISRIVFALGGHGVDVFLIGFEGGGRFYDRVLGGWKFL